VTESKRQRRPKGAGSLRHLDSDRWQVTVKVGGKRLSRVFHAPNQTQANRAADAVRIELQADRARDANTDDAERAERQTWTVEQYVAYYFRVGACHLANTTRERYSQITKHQIIPHLGKKRMAEVTVADLKAMYSALGGKNARRYGGKLSGQTILTVHMVVRAIFKFACDEQEDFEKNPAARASAKPKIEQVVRKRGLDVAEVERFVALAREQAAPEVAVAVMLSARLGTRRGETLALRWCDVNVEQGEITVCRSVTQTPEDGVDVKDTTKTGKQRIIPLDADTVGELKTLQREQRERRLSLGKGWQGADSPADDYIVTTVPGAGLTPNVFANGFRTLAKQNRLAHITPHILRHAWVSQMIALGFDAVTIAAMTGHSPDVLYRTYAHAFDKRKREAVDALGEARKAARAAK
jgi:integrase